eukprot:Gb_21247 [translate_table: standard]
MPERDVVSWTVMIAAYASHGFNEVALGLFYQMQRTVIKPDHFTFASLLATCTNLATLKQVHEYIIGSKIQSDIFVENALVDTYAKCGRYAQNGNVEGALQLFQNMPEQNVVSWNAIVAGYAQAGHTMTAGYAPNGHVDEALKLFGGIPQLNVVSWNAMIAGYAQNGHGEEALNLFRQLQLAGLNPNSKTFVSLLPAGANLAALAQGKEIHEEIIRRGFQSDLFVASALVDMYANCSSIEIAHALFDEMPQYDVLAVVKPNSNTFVGVLPECANLGVLEQGTEIHEKNNKKWISVIYRCGKCLCRHVCKMWEHRECTNATLLRNPDRVTFVSVLSACCHAGLVDKSWQYFDCMSQNYHITPAMEHYGCMVDLLGRAGHLDEAQEFMSKMPIIPDATVWRCLLAACRIHNNVQLGEHVAEQFLALDCENSAPYVLLSNIYAAAGRWDDIEKVRKMMKDRRIKKKPGCSWIEVNNQVCAFLAGDRSHPQTRKIYAKLDILLGQMKAAGYVPNTRFVLNDVEEEQKERILCYHSEKLAIVFGLINISSSTTIRFIKNL